MIRILIFTLSVVFFAGTALAAPQPDERLNDPRMQERALALYDQLRCVICQSQSIGDSDAHIARDMRSVVRERLIAGDNDREVLNYMQQRYGDYVLMMPPVQGNTLLLWLTPILVLLIGGGGAVFYMRAQTNQASEDLDAADEARVAELLAEEGRE